MLSERMYLLVRSMHLLGVGKVIYLSQLSGIFLHLALHLALRNVMNIVPRWQKYKVLYKYKFGLYYLAQT